MSFLSVQHVAAKIRRTGSHSHSQRDNKIKIASYCDFADRKGDHNSRQVREHDEKTYSLPALRRRHAALGLTKWKLRTFLHHGVNHLASTSASLSLASCVPLDRFTSLYNSFGQCILGAAKSGWEKQPMSHEFSAEHFEPEHRRIHEPPSTMLDICKICIS